MEEVIRVTDCGENFGDYNIPIHKAIIIPEDATNRDVIGALFPDVEIKESIDTVHLKYRTINSDPLFFVQVSKKWWNASYKTESEDK